MAVDRCKLHFNGFWISFFALLLASFFVLGFALGDQVTPLLLRLSQGRDLQALIRQPTDVKSGERIPLVLLFGGFEEAGKVLGLFEPGVRVAVASFDYPFSPPRKFHFPGSFWNAPEAKRAAHLTLEGIGVLHKTFLEVSSRQYSPSILVGASFGAPFAIAAAAAAADGGAHPYQGLVILHGFAKIPETATALIAKKWEKKAGILGRWAAWLVCRLSWAYLRFPSPEQSIPRLNSDLSVLMISASQDSFVPKESTAALKELFERSKVKFEFVELPGDHLQPGSDELIKKLKTLTVAWMKRERLVGP